MTGLIDEEKNLEADRPQRASSRERHLTITVIVLVLALVGLAAWVAYDRAASPATAVTEEIDNLVDDYLGAWNSYDEEALVGFVTDDYVLHMNSGSVSMIQEAAEATEMFGTLEERDWKEESIGEPIMIGNGPWFVAEAQHFTATAGYPPEGVNGISTFTIVDDGGTLKIARHTYVGNN